MASVTTWARIEPHARAAGMDAGLEMRVHDPLWMLARQWQFGEFQGEDTGSPVWTRWNGVESPLGLYLPGSIDGHAPDDVRDYASNQPLEYVVEGERLPALDVLRANRRLAVEAGLQFLRLLGEPRATNQRATLLRTYAVPPLSPPQRAALDPESIAFLDLAAGRALDGAGLLDVCQNASATGAAMTLGFTGADATDAAAAITAWLAWCTANVGDVGGSRTRPAWNPARMEYACAVAAPAGPAGAQTVLAAREFNGGRLDWYSFDAVAGATLQRALTVQSRSFEAAALPTNLSFRGMPANRLWEFEDAQVRFGSIEAGPTDLARVLLVEFLVEYGNDFFMIPIDVDAGSLVNIATVTVTNTFGDVTNATPFANQEWRLFALSSDSSAQASQLSTALFVPSVLGPHLAGAPLEHVQLVRDEMANVAWAIEHVVLSAAGRPLNRHEAFQARLQRDKANRPRIQGKLVYRLDTWQSSHPDFWIPLLPEQRVAGASTVRLTCYDPQGNSRGQLLSEKGGASALSLFDEEVPRMGAQIRRNQQYTRWYGGSTFTWIGREKRAGRGGGSSGLRQDVIEVVKIT